MQCADSAGLSENDLLTILQQAIDGAGLTFGNILIAQGYLKIVLKQIEI